MSDAPEKIWANPRMGLCTEDHDWEGDTEYTRTDLCEAAISRARAEGRAEALRECREIAKAHRPDRPLQSRATADAIDHAIAALQETPDACG